MESSLDMPALEKQTQLDPWRHWGQADSPTGVIPALLPPHNLLRLSPGLGAKQILGGDAQQSLEELRGTL
jgi:hypothetical protein